MMPTAPQGPPPEQIHMAIEASKARIIVLDNLCTAYTNLLGELPPGGTVNGLQVIVAGVACGPDVTEIATDPLRAIITAHIAAWDLERQALQGQIAGLERMLPGHLLLARTRLA